MRNALASKTVCDDSVDIIEAQRLATQISIKASEYFASIKAWMLYDIVLFIGSPSYNWYFN